MAQQPAGLGGAILTEGARRLRLWEELRQQGGSMRVPKAVLRELGIYGGFAGIWVDAEHTRGISQNEFGVTVSVLHTGKVHAEDLREESVLFHYPHTARPARRDLSEVEATKNARRLGLPVFVIVGREAETAFRDVHLGWVDHWDDVSEVFLIVFDREAEAIAPVAVETLEPFALTEQREKQFALAARRDQERRFRFAVFQRYGPCCALCDLDIPELLEGAHLMPWAQGGADDPRNGLVLCVLHHRALDAGLFGIDPQDFSIQTAGRFTKAALHISRGDLSHLPQKPHQEAVTALWQQFRGRQL